MSYLWLFLLPAKGHSKGVTASGSTENAASKVLLLGTDFGVLRSDVFAIGASLLVPLLLELHPMATVT